VGSKWSLRDATAADKTCCSENRTLYAALSAFRHHCSCQVCSAAVACKTTAAASAVSALLLPRTPVTLLYKPPEKVQQCLIQCSRSVAFTSGGQCVVYFVEIAQHGLQQVEHRLPARANFLL